MTVRSSKKQNLYLGVDIGGSSTKFVVVSLPRMGVNNFCKHKTPKTRKELLRLISGHVNEFEQGYGRKLTGVGVALAGVFDASSKKILHSPNLPAFNNWNIYQVVKAAVKRPLFVGNDANAFTLGESMLGAAKGFRRVFGMTIGTGVGGGLFSNGQLEIGANGGAGEIGHSVVVAGGKQCTCGGHGHLEEYITTRAFLRLGGYSPSVIAVKARKGDKRSQKVFDVMTGYLAIALANIVNIWDPEAIVIGGGIAQDSDLFLKLSLYLSKKEILSPQAARGFVVKVAKLGEYSGAIGAILFNNKNKL